MLEPMGRGGTERDGAGRGGREWNRQRGSDVGKGRVGELGGRCRWKSEIEFKLGR